MEEEEAGPEYGCPRCGALYDAWRGMRLHLRSSPRCRTVFEDLDKTKAMQKQCREAARRSSRTKLMAGSGRGSGKLPSMDGTASLAEEEVSGPEAENPVEPLRLGPKRISSAGGVGGHIVDASGQLLGAVVAEERRAWRLADGRVVRKAAEGRKWRWQAEGVEALERAAIGCTAAAAVPSTDGETTAPSSRAYSSSETSPMLLQGRPPRSAAASPLLLPEPSAPLAELGELRADAEAEDEECIEVGPAACGIGAEIVGADGKPWGTVVAEERNCWRLARGRTAKKAMEGRKWHWAALRPEAAPQPARRSVRSEGGEWPEVLVLGTCDWLPLESALCAMRTCKDWAAALTDHVPLTLPPPQADALLQFCLLEVLVRFDDDRLPLPISALYSEMRLAERRVATSSVMRRRVEESIFRTLGPAYKSQQEQFLRQRRPHHVAWSAELKSSGFRTLERLAKHFGVGQDRLIEIFHQRWQKQIHHTPNTRTCWEWVLTKVNRQHPLWVEHATWRLEVAPLAAEELEAAKAER